MTKHRAPLSVRLDPVLAQALDRLCERTGETRSRVVQQSVAEYLVEHSGPTLGGLAEALLPPLAARPAAKARAPRRKRYREYVREKRRR